MEIVFELHHIDMSNLVMQWEDSLSEKYPHIVYEEHSKGTNTDQCKQDSVINCDSDELEGKYLIFL